MLTQGPVGRHLVDMTVPVLFGITTMMTQSLIDTWFIGRVGDRELAAFGFGFPILMIVTSIAIGLGAGTSSVVARAIGSNDHQRARRLLGAPEDLLPLIRGFMLILYSGVPFIVVGMVGMASMRATGDTRLPSMLMVLASVLNVIFDPILIFGIGPVPAMGLNGAAMAALLARATIFIGTLYLMKMRLDMVSFNKPDPKELRKSWVDVLHVGLPAAGTNAIVPLAAVVVTAMIARYGADAVAGFGVASRVESTVLVIFYAMSSIIGPFVGQNFSAGRERRILHALWLCAIFCIASGLVIAIVLALFSSSIAALFSQSEDVISVTRLFLWVVPVSYGTYGMVMVMNAAFNGLGKPMPAVWISVARTFVLYVPLAFIGTKLFGMIGIFAAYAVANIVSGIGAYVWARSTAHRLCTDD